MTQNRQPRQRKASLRWPGRPLVFNIRTKIILPYLILTLIVAIIGTYVVTRLVAASLDERLTNHLLETGRVVSDTLASQEAHHTSVARQVAFTQGVAEALAASDQEGVATPALRAIADKSIQTFAVVDAQGRQVLHVLRSAEGHFEDVSDQADASTVQMVQQLLAAGDLATQPRQGIGIHPVDGRYYYFTAVPVRLEERMVGVLIIGTSLDTLLPQWKDISLANIIVYLDGGRAVASTFAPTGPPQEGGSPLDALAIAPTLYEECLLNTEVTIGENFQVNNRWYRIARGPLQVGGAKLGVFAVVLPSHFIIEAGATSRDTYALLFAAATACVILVGYIVSRRITSPLGRLVRVSQAVADGDLNRRTDIKSQDEIGVLAATFDGMTERLAERTRELERLLYEQKTSSSRMRAILSSIGDGVLLEDLEGNLVPQNTAAESMLADLAADFALAPLRETVTTGQDQLPDSTPWLVESRRLEVSNKVISVSAAAVHTDDGERLGNVIVLRDVTAEAEAERLKDAFITHVSHELRTPLTAIKGYSELLLVNASSNLDRQQIEFLETINHHTNNLVAMVEELLDFSEMEAGGRIGLQRRPIQFGDLVNEICVEWRPELEDKGLEFEVDIPSDLPLINADPRRMRWAVTSLIRNAWQYTPSGGRVTVRLSAHEDQVILDVADTGIGIPPKEQAKLFTRFYRVTQQRSGVRGFGLGLYVTKMIVEAHRGEIRVDSQEGKGSTFSILLRAQTE